jgi:hypothetical protein
MRRASTGSGPSDHSCRAAEGPGRPVWARWRHPAPAPRTRRLRGPARGPLPRPPAAACRPAAGRAGRPPPSPAAPRVAAPGRGWPAAQALLPAAAGPPRPSRPSARGGRARPGRGPQRRRPAGRPVVRPCWPACVAPPLSSPQPPACRQPTAGVCVSVMVAAGLGSCIHAYVWGMWPGLGSCMHACARVEPCMPSRDTHAGWIVIHSDREDV